MRPYTRLGQCPGSFDGAVRRGGELAIKADVLREQLKTPGHGLPFDKVISSNIGNPQQKGLDQPPINFTRQLPALADLAPGIFPADVVASQRSSARSSAP
ncbi:hypothetical protein B0H13DRAFT_2321698 [Mycena leptocephala]|nr:hypothetical protein B0H13DRAFT_2321698 [Mycena leptocephala]